MSQPQVYVFVTHCGLVTVRIPVVALYDFVIFFEADNLGPVKYVLTVVTPNKKLLVVNEPKPSIEETLNVLVTFVPNVPNK